MRLSRSGAAFGSLAGVALLVSAAAAATEITDATADQRLSQAESAFRQGRPDEATRLLNEVTRWANHIRDSRRGMRDPAADAAFAERMYQRVLATIGRTFGADNINAGDALVGLATLDTDQQRYAEAEALLRRALAAVAGAQAPADRKQSGEGRVVRDLAKLYEQQGKNALAEAAYRRAADLFDNAGPRFTRERDEALVRGARLLRATGRPADAAALEARCCPSTGQPPLGRRSRKPGTRSGRRSGRAAPPRRTGSSRGPFARPKRRPIVTSRGGPWTCSPSITSRPAAQPGLEPCAGGSRTPGRPASGVLDDGARGGAPSPKGGSRWLSSPARSFSLPSSLPSSHLGCRAARSLRRARRKVS